MWCVIARTRAHLFVLHLHPTSNHICKHNEYRHIVTMIEWSPVWRILNSHSDSQWVNNVHLKTVYIREHKMHLKKKERTNERTNERRKRKHTTRKLYRAHPKSCIFAYCLRTLNCVKFRQFMIEYVILWLYPLNIHIYHESQSDKIWKTEKQIRGCR